MDEYYEPENMLYVVTKILEAHPETRNSDDLLLMEYTRKVLGRPIFLPDSGISFKMLKTLERNRRKCQELNQHLRAGQEVEAKRSELNEEFKRGRYEI